MLLKLFSMVSPIRSQCIQKSTDSCYAYSLELLQPEQMFIAGYDKMSSGILCAFKNSVIQCINQYLKFHFRFDNHRAPADMFNCGLNLFVYPYEFVFQFPGSFSENG